MIHFIIGTRAQLIKTAPIMAECQRGGIRYNFIFLAQHRQTIYEIIDLFGIKRPDFTLADVGRDITSVREIAWWAAKVFALGIKGRRSIFRGDTGGIVLVHGDALPAIIGAILARAAGLRVGHVEAGLRSFDYMRPFPEELIRVLIWKLRLPDFYFCPNDWAMKNVERYPGKKINTKCNTLFDSLRTALDFELPDEEALIPSEEYAIATLHRFETISSRQKLEEVLSIIREVTRRIKLLFILHPPTLAALKNSGLYDTLDSDPNIELRPRYDYFRFIRLLKGSRFVITDGGSNQEECFYLGHPCLLLRDTTERTEGLGENVALSKFDSAAISDFLREYDSFRREMPVMEMRPSEIILEAIRQYW
jgi:UDP-N-acetylglucosamine 2-epimerase (non-hydrolysing)